MRILVVEDHVVMREGLKLLVESQGLTVARECSLAGECLQALEEAAFDLVLLDLKLPDMDGLALTRQLSHSHPNLPVLVLSTYEDIPTVVSAIRAGARGYLVKTAEAGDLRMALSTVAAGGCYLHPRVAALTLAELSQSAAGWASLSAREAEVIRAVVEGLANAEIAQRLHVSLGTVKRDLAQLFTRLNLKDRAELVAEAARRHWH